MKRLHIIINPASGTDFPILSVLNRTLQSTRVDWEISVTKKKGDIKEHVQRALRNDATAVAIYGGDGSVMEAAQALYQKETPLLILPGGSANVLAKELEIPLAVDAALDLFLRPRFKQKKIDMAICNRIPFLIRLNIGVFASVVLQANPQLKQAMGQVAYQVAAFQSIQTANPSKYSFHIDGKKIEEEGVSLIIANSGNLGVSGIALDPDMHLSDGQIHVFLLQNTNLGYLATVAQKTFTKDKTPMGHWKGKKIVIEQVDPPQDIVLDDVKIEAKKLHIHVVPKALSIIVP